MVDWLRRLQPVISIPDRSQYRGVTVACGVLGTWALSTALWLSLDWQQISWGIRCLGFLCQTFLYTGLFVTAHDAMHGSVAPRDRQLNDCIGQIALFCYAMFPFKKMAEMHHLHHAIPARPGDPDYHNGRWTHFFGWYAQFMVNYWSWIRLFLLICSFHVVHQLFHIEEANLTCFWVLPSVASSFQLFFFGTFLPHREPAEGYHNPCHARSTAFSEFWSFITCYHFGYHEEHHELPHLAWWQLPAARRMRMGS
ncbi:fatty acid desaturase [Alkalinema pantanalense CENA528]|uniref:fatty acid desaturase n=1 Tax=Alkalinema pantanalense TaxID=1620705 RepID=UPI003D6FA217